MEITRNNSFIEKFKNEFSKLIIVNQKSKDYINEYTNACGIYNDLANCDRMGKIKQ